MTLPISPFFHWAKLLSKFISTQLVVQALTLASGILIVRNLNKQEYALYTIATTMQGTMSLLADMGISIGLSSIGGKVWQDRYRFGQLINTALQVYQLIISQYRKLKNGSIIQLMNCYCTHKKLLTVNLFFAPEVLVLHLFVYLRQ